MRSRFISGGETAEIPNAWPLNLTSLRVLDDDLRRAALAVIEWSAVRDRELHEYLEGGHQLMQRFAAIEKQEEQ
ncbi:hypothetical protein [Halomonas sp. QHL1]|uniref:DUF7673 family protein n=1 Tax=Halomonas sp. QHL1 TaxID=1123773 RepID=UPI0008FD42F6|nr:hypothetical protein [Halomonas sp. QHL1]OJA07129.1 hypothetical protein QHL1GM_17865 [Halomonas sp. QHL1]